MAAQGEEDVYASVSEISGRDLVSSFVARTDLLDRHRVGNTLTGPQNSFF